MEKKWFKSALAMLLVIAMVAGVVPSIPDSVSEADAAYTDNGTADVTIFAEDEDGTGRFPDVTRLADDSLVAVCYWNGVSHHAPFAYGDPMGSVKISYGSADGKTWSEPEVLITPEKLAEWGLGVWYVEDSEGNITFYYTAKEAEENGAQLAVEARDPNVELMDDGTLILTFFSRVPDECSFNGYTFEKNDNEGQDFTAGRAYITYSKDNGSTWAVPTEIESDLMVRGSCKRGNMAFYPDGQILIPLQGYDDVQSNAKHGSCVLVELNEDGTWTFLRETRMWGATGSDESTYTWDSEHSFAVTTLNGQEVTYDLVRGSASLLISYDRGLTWETIAEHVEKNDSYYEGAGEKLQQPSVCNIEGTNQLFFTWTEAVGTLGQRDVYGKIYTPGEDWSKTEAVLLYKNFTGGGNDIGDPTGIQLANGELFTIYYDVADRKVGAVFNSVDELRKLRSENELESEADEWNIYEMDFENEENGDFLDQSGTPLWMDVTNSGAGDGTAKVQTDAETGNKYLIMNGDASADRIEFWFNDIGPDTTFSFDFKMPATTQDSWQQWLVGVGTGNADVLNWQFAQSSGEHFVRLCDSLGTLASVHYNGSETAEAKRFDDVFEIGEWYSVKFVWDGYRTFMKLWKQGDVEPNNYMFEAQNINFMRANKIYMRFGTGVESDFYLDNLKISKHTKLSIVEEDDNTLGYAFSRNIMHELPVPAVTWSSNNSSVVKVDQNGNLTYVGEGTATITACCGNLIATKEISVGNSWKLHDLDFEEQQTGNWTTPTKYGMAYTNWNNTAATATIMQEEDNKYLELKHTTRASSELSFPVNSPSTLSFDFKLATAIQSEGWDQINISLGSNYNPMWQIMESNGTKLLRLYDTSEHYRVDEKFVTGTEASWYTAKFVWDGDTVTMTLWEKGKSDTILYSQEAQHTGFTTEQMVRIKYATNEITSSVYLDNIVLSKITNFSIIDDGSGTLGYKFDRDVTQELPVPIVTWSSSDSNVISIDENGKLTYVGAGTATITATCDNLTATKEITVDAWKFHDMDFDDDAVGEWKASDKYGMSFTDYDKDGASQSVKQDGNNKYLELNHTSKLVSEIIFNANGATTMSFDFKMPTAFSSGWDQINISLGSANYNPMWQIMESDGTKFLRLYDTSEHYRVDGKFATGTTAPWYTAKFVWKDDVATMTICEKESPETILYTQEATHTGFSNNNQVIIKYANSTGTSSLYLDNITLSKITNFSIVDVGSNTLSYAFDRDVTTELPAPNVTWSSSNEDVVRIDKTTGVMTYVGAGKTTVTATCDNLTATKEIEVCEVNINMQGHGGENSSQYLRKGDKATVPTTPTEENYTFNGWYTEAAGRTAYNFDNEVSENITIYAKWTYNHNIYDMDFEDAPIGDYLVQDGNGLWMEKDTALTTVERDETTDNQYLSVTGDWINFWFNNMSTESTLSFDFQMPTSSTGWDRLAVAVGYRDDSLKYAWKFEQWQGWTSIKYVNAADEEQTQSDAFEIGSWYSVKLEWDSEWISAKIWKKDVTEPESYTFIVKNANFIKDNKVSFNYYTNADSKIYLDNIRFYKESNYLGGDVNDDAVVDVRDLVRLKKHVSGAEHTWGGNCDVDNHGTVDNIDLDILRDTYLLGKGTSASLKNALSGKYVSILGDSISTFIGVSNVVENNTTTEGYTPEYDGYKGGVTNQNQTYWGQIIEEYNMNLLVNNACGANKLTWNGTSYLPDVSAGYIRAEELAANTGILNGTKPDIIFMNMGTNDYIGNVTLGALTDDTYTNVIVDGTYKTPETFTEAYIITLEKMQDLYPDAKVFCFTLMPSMWNTDWTVLDSYNTRIREIVAHYDNVYLVDVAQKITTSNYSYYMYDDTHPTAVGMTVMARELEKALQRFY